MTGRTPGSDPPEGQLIPYQHKQGGQDHIGAVPVQEVAAPQPDQTDQQIAGHDGGCQDRHRQEQEESPVLRPEDEALQKEKEIVSYQKESQIVAPARGGGMCGERMCGSGVGAEAAPVCGRMVDDKECIQYREDAIHQRYQERAVPFHRP